MKRKLAMFDMDGILMNSMPYHASAWKQTIHEYGLDCGEDVFYANEGRTCEGTVRCLFPQWADREDLPGLCEEIYRRKGEIFHQMSEPDPMEGALDVVKAVREAGLKAIVVTGSGDDRIMDRISTAYPGLFDMESMVSAHDVRLGKPAPEPYLMGMRKSGGYSPDECIVIENAPLGIQAGHASGAFTIAVNTGPLPDSVLLDSGADILFHSMGELAGKITGLLERI